MRVSDEAICRSGEVVNISREVVSIYDVMVSRSFLKK